jgi:hypothetical protein
VARRARRGPVLLALMVTMALAAMDNNIVSTAVGTLVAVPVLVPRRFATAPGAAASTGPAEQAGPAAPVPSTGDKSG